MFDRAVVAGADVVILDLEDAVRPDLKMQARRNVVAYLATANPAPIRRAVRINKLSSCEGLRDLIVLLETPIALDFVVIPKVESAETVRLVDSLLRESGQQCRIVSMIETGAGLLAAERIAQSCECQAFLMFGAADYAADVGCDLSWHSLAFVRTQLIACAAAAGIPVIDSPWFDLSDPDGLLAESRQAYRSGFRGKAAIHPAQIATINEHCRPDPAAIEAARSLLRDGDQGARTVGGRMVDRAMMRDAIKTLERLGHGPTEPVGR